MLKDHNAVTPVRLEPAAPRSRIKHCTTEPLRSHPFLVTYTLILRNVVPKQYDYNTQFIYTCFFFIIEIYI